MNFKHKITLVLLTVAVLAFVLAANLTPQPTSAQTQALNLRALLENVKGNNVQVSIQFAAPLVPGEALWTFPDTKAKRQIADIGDDFVCFSEPWNNATRLRCTPFVNIVSVNYVP